MVSGVPPSLEVPEKCHSFIYKLLGIRKKDQLVQSGLNRLPDLHPIAYQPGSLPGGQKILILGTASRLDAFSAYPTRT
jgi:hypothetical protein